MVQKESLAIQAKLSAASLIAQSNVKPSTSFSVEEYFGENTSKGYMMSDEKISYLQTVKQTPNGMTYLRILFSNLQNGFKMTSPILPRKDRWGNLYTWMTFNPGPPTKIILESGMEQFITDILDGKISPNFSLQDLANEADRLQALKSV